MVNLSRGELQLSAVVTAGVSNAVSAGLTPPAQINPPPGTINIILLFACPLTPSALVNAVITASEAKTDVLRRRKILTPQGLPPTELQLTPWPSLSDGWQSLPVRRAADFAAGWLPGQSGMPLSRRFTEE